MNIIWFYQRYRGSVICVQNGLWGIHKGIIHSVEISGQFATIWIIDNNPHRQGVGFCTLEDFTGGQPAWLERIVEPSQAGAVIRRAESLVGCSYDLLTFNCEHFVTLALGQEAESKQLQAWALLAVGAVAASLIADSTLSRRTQRRRRRR